MIIIVITATGFLFWQAQRPLSWLLAELSAASCAATWCFPGQGSLGVESRIFLSTLNSQTAEGLRGIQLGLALNVVTSPLLLLLVAAFIRLVQGCSKLRVSQSICAARR